MGRELQRTYRGRAWREEDPDDKRGLHEVDRTEHAVMIASMGCSPVEETDRLTEMAELLHTAGPAPRPAGSPPVPGPRAPR